ncbi:type I-MYXAN CRISPR-associated protein Cas5/Cmx5/DevS [soil metagenome]
MITIYVEVPFASFRKSFARSYAETYTFPPPSTIYGMLLSLVGERFRKRHEGVRLAFAYKRIPKTATTIRKLSRYKYGIPSKQSLLGNAPDYIETLCGIEFLCWVDSSQEINREENLEQRITEALENPEQINRQGILYLGLSDDAVNDISICDEIKGKWYRLLPDDKGFLELPIWADHIRGIDTRWQRFELEKEAKEIESFPDSENWKWLEITDPRK